MIVLNLNEGNHLWQKQNLTTLFDGKRHFDIMKCERCGIEGKTKSLSTITVKSSYSHEKIYNCIGRQEQATKQIQITKCNAFGPQFTNLTSGSIHDVIEPPEGYKEDARSVWVMGVGEPVKVLNDEFTFV